MIKKVLLLAGILAVFSTTKAHPATDNDTIEVVYADTTGIDIDSIEASIDHIELDEVTVEASAWVRKADRNLLFPNAQQIKQSKNGLQLLQKLQIPGIVINPTDNSISLTDKSELSLRINIRRTRNLLLVATGLLTATTTAFCGPISFIGLAVPHIARLMLGTSNHNSLLPVTMLTGGAIALLCNFICILPGEAGIIPLNAVTPVIGAPIIIYVIVNQRKIQYFN